MESKENNKLAKLEKAVKELSTKFSSFEGQMLYLQRYEDDNIRLKLRLKELILELLE